MKRKITSFILLLAMLVSIVAVLPIASAAADTTLKGTDVTLTDGVLLNFYVEADDTLGIDNAEKDGNYYVLTVDVAAKEMGDDVTAEFKAGATVVGSHTYSVADYAAGILAGNYDAETKALVTAMLNYGAAAQKYFKYETDALVGTPVTDTTALKAATVAPVAVEGDGFIGASLILEGTMTLRFYFAGTVDSATVDGEAADVNADAAEYCYVDVKVTPDNIDKAYEVVADDTTVKYSVLNYLQRNADNAALTEMVASIYAYSVAAESYVAIKNCTHEGAEFETVQLPTLFTEGVKIGYCELCNQIVEEKIEKTTANSAVYTYDDSGIREEKASFATLLADGSHFYPVGNEPAKELVIEFSFLWDNTFCNSYLAEKDSYIYMGMIADVAGGNRITSYHLCIDKVTDFWCQHVGGFEPDDNKYVLAGPSMVDGGSVDQFPNIGDYGWHRLGFKMRQTSAIKNNAVEHTVITELYIDGAFVSSYKWIRNNTQTTKLLYTATIEDGELVYSDSILDERYAFAYQLKLIKASKNKEIYFATADTYITVGHDFVIDVEKVENPEDATFEVAPGKTTDGTVHFQVVAD